MPIEYYEEYFCQVFDITQSLYREGMSDEYIEEFIRHAEIQVVGCY